MDKSLPLSLGLNDTVLGQLLVWHQKDNILQRNDCIVKRYRLVDQHICKCLFVLIKDTFDIKILKNITSYNSINNYSIFRMNLSSSLLLFNFFSYKIKSLESLISLQWYQTVSSSTIVRVIKPSRSHLFFLQKQIIKMKAGLSNSKKPTKCHGDSRRLSDQS